MAKLFSISDKPVDPKTLTKDQKIQRILEINESLKSDPEKYAVFVQRLKKLTKKKD